MEMEMEEEEGKKGEEIVTESFGRPIEGSGNLRSRDLTNERGKWWPTRHYHQCRLSLGISSCSWLWWHVHGFHYEKNNPEQDCLFSASLLLSQILHLRLFE